MTANSASAPPLEVVLIDDEPRTLHILRWLIEDGEHFRVAGLATCLDEAAALLARTSASVLVIDVHMPELDGFEVARRLRAADATLQIVLTSSTDDAVYDEISRDVGARGFVPKRSLCSSVLVDVLGARPEAGL